jgi:Putative DNA-binding domain
MICAKPRPTNTPFDVQHRHIIYYTQDSPSDFIYLQSEITTRLKAQIEKAATMQTVESLSPVKTTDGLSSYEIMAMVSIMEDRLSPAGLNEDQPGVLFVGVNNDGTIQDQGINFEDLLRKISGELSNIYPPVYPTILVREKDARKFVAVIAYGSPDRPHFAGKSYVRDGTQTKEASESNIEELIAKRSSKVAEILKWKGQEITVNWQQQMMARKFEVQDCDAVLRTPYSGRGYSSEGPHKERQAVSPNRKDRDGCILPAAARCHSGVKCNQSGR